MLANNEINYSIFIKSSDKQYKNIIYIILRMIDPALKLLAEKYVCEKMICRKCYARLNIRTKNCRKCKSTDLRVKKKVEIDLIDLMEYLDKYKPKKKQNLKNRY